MYLACGDIGSIIFTQTVKNSDHFLKLMKSYTEDHMLLNKHRKFKKKRQDSLIKAIIGEVLTEIPNLPCSYT